MKNWLLFAVGLSFAASANAASSIQLPSIDFGSSSPQDVSSAMKVLALLTVLSLAPAVLIMMTSFTRIIIVLSMLRHALGMQNTPPNIVLTSLSLFLTLFTMNPVLEKMNSESFQPLAAEKINTQQAYDKSEAIIRQFMIKNTREKDLKLVIEMSGTKNLKSVNDVKMTNLLPAFMLSELQTAFQIGFVIFLPFLLIDLIVASVLMSMGMIMLPPTSIALPIKILLFILVDGWALVVQGLVGSFH